MGIHVIVFDFDGTLIESNRLKYDAYFSLFPADDRHAAVIRSVLSRAFEQSRYLVLEEILRALGGREGSRADEVERLARRYNEIVVAGAKTCPEKAGAEAALKRLSPLYGLYVSSTTPEPALREIVRYRKWDGYFRRVFGFPRKKPDTLREIMQRENAASGQVLVVGDGESDRRSAMENRCPFVHVAPGFRFADLARALENGGWETGDHVVPAGGAGRGRDLTFSGSSGG